jgi:hypothetical protein
LLASIDLLEEHGHPLWSPRERQVLLQGLDLVLQLASLSLAPPGVLPDGRILRLQLGQDGLGLLDELAPVQYDISDGPIEDTRIQEGAVVVRLPMIIAVVALIASAAVDTRGGYRQGQSCRMHQRRPLSS